jgi:hypothetical protein
MKKKFTYKDYIKANRKGSRDGELLDSTGWIQKHKIHKSMKDYKRKKLNIYNYEEY